MLKIPNDMVAGTIHETSNFGSIVIVEYINSTCIHVAFKNTGFKATVCVSMIRKGCVKDKLLPSVFGVGFFGDGEFISSAKNKQTESYKCWVRMLRRCYCDKYQLRFKAYIGCTVHSDWHNFQNFAAWHKENYPNDGLKYDLDKDILIDGNRQYSQLACKFVLEGENIAKAKAIYFSIKSPLGEVHTSYNISKFARDHDLQRGHLSAVLRGERNHHKGWRKP